MIEYVYYCTYDDSLSIECNSPAVLGLFYDETACGTVYVGVL